MKKRQRKSYTTAFKVKIALEAIKGQRTTNEIATHSCGRERTRCAT